MKQNKQGFSEIIFIFIIIILVGVAGWFVYQNNLLKQEVSQTEVNPTPIANLESPSPSPVINVPADWKTYVAEDNIFTVDYPKSWKLEDIDETVINYPGRDSDINMIVLRGAEGNIWISYGSFPTLCYDYGSKKIEQETILINGKKYEGCSMFILNDGRKSIRFFETTKNKDTLDFTAEINKPVETNEPTILKIISSLDVTL